MALASLAVRAVHVAENMRVHGAAGLPEGCAASVVTLRRRTCKHVTCACEQAVHMGARLQLHACACACGMCICMCMCMCMCICMCIFINKACACCMWTGL